jgi:hypothetical protein
MSRTPMDDSNKLKIQSDFIRNMTKAIEKELDNINEQYSGFGPNRRNNFKKALGNSLIFDSQQTEPNTHVPQNSVPDLKELGFDDISAREFVIDVVG